MDEPVNNIQRVVLDAISDLKFYGATMKDYRWLENIAVKFYRTKLRGFNMPSLVSVEVGVDNATRIWAFPADFIRYTKIAYRHNGRLWTLGYDNSLDLSEVPEPCGDSIDDATIEPRGGFWFAPYITGGRTYYATGGGFNVNYYRPNYEKGYIQFSESLPVGRAVIEYLSAGRQVDGYTLVPIAYEYAFNRYLKWQYCDLNPRWKAAAGGFRQEYEGAMWDANILSKAPTQQELLDEIYRSCGFRLR